MKYNRFRSVYKLTRGIAGDMPALNDSIATRGILELATGVYNDGLYVILPRNEAVELTRLVESVFPVAQGKIAIFATDWMGRLFATDTLLTDSGGAATVTCFDLAEPASFTTEVNFDEFHNKEAVDMMVELLNLNQFAKWTALNAPPRDGVSCVGYKVPLFIGGTDAIEN